MSKSKSPQILHDCGPHSMMIRADIVQLCEEIQQGDGIQWEGDPALNVTFNEGTQRYELWRYFEGRNEGPLNSWPADQFDKRVLKWLVEHDMWKQDLIGQIEAQDALIDRRNDRDLEDLEGELRDFVRTCEKLLGTH